MPATNRPSPLAARIAAVTQQQGGTKYITTENGCTCPDYKYRSRICKHMLLLEADKVREEYMKQVEDMSNFF
jgi:predicted nucleic acid-binding Zn finger protein